MRADSKAIGLLRSVETCGSGYYIWHVHYLVSDVADDCWVVGEAIGEKGTVRGS